MKRLSLGLLAGMALVAGGTAQAAAESVAPHATLRVQLSPDLPSAPGGRLLVFAKPLPEGKSGTIRKVDADYAQPLAVSLAAREVAWLPPGAVTEIDLDDGAFPAAFSQLPPGDYAVQAVLDVNHNYNYRGRSVGDIVSPVVELKLPLKAPTTLTLAETLPGRDPWSMPPGPVPEAHKAMFETLAKRMAEAKPATFPIEFVSPSLSKFWGRPITMRGWVVTPPGYDAAKATKYPTVYYSHGFMGSSDTLTRPAGSIYDGMKNGRTPAMIWVLLDQSSPSGTHEFADSVNNGPWGTALTSELIPELERKYRMDARPSGRLLQGHSSGGWMALWLQTTYPKLFGGAWATSPDAGDFHDFSGIDLYAPGANFYRAADGTPRPLVREKGKVMATTEMFAGLEQAQGSIGGQFRSFEWVFSPRGTDGTPMPMFDRATGQIDPVVVKYWADNYEIAHKVRTNWPKLKPDLYGKLHITVGGADTFYLDGSARRLQATLDELGAGATFAYVPDRTHFDLYKDGDNETALLDKIANEAYAVARPKGKAAN